MNSFTIKTTCVSSITEVKRAVNMLKDVAPKLPNSEEMHSYFWCFLSHIVRSQIRKGYSGYCKVTLSPCKLLIRGRRDNLNGYFTHFTMVF
jgi:hypothetical protein